MNLSLLKSEFKWRSKTELKDGLKILLKNCEEKKEIQKNNSLIRLSRSSIDSEEVMSVAVVLQRGYLGMGKEVKIFETRLSKFIGRPVVCVSSGTSALQLAIQACNIGSGDEILVPSYTYIATFQAISATGAKPIICDIDKETLTISTVDIERKITSKTKAIIAVHIGGDCLNIDKIIKIARKHNLRLIEDAAHSFGSKYKNKLVASFGDITCFSFDGIKNLTTGEGGCIVSKDVNVIKRAADLRLLAVKGDSQCRYSNKRNLNGLVHEQGWRYHMSNINASIGIVQLKKINQFGFIRRKIANRYSKELSEIKDLHIVRENYDEIIPHSYSVLLSTPQLKEAIIKSLREKNIEIGSGYFPNHFHPKYTTKKNSFPNTEEVHSRIITLPIHALLSDSEQTRVIKEIRNFFKNG